eukprot:scaffold87289_cov60-Phaeocystis_antarctica.AAC.3
MFPERAQSRGLEPPSMSNRSSTLSEEIAFQPSRIDQPRMDVGMSMKILANPSAPPRRRRAAAPPHCADNAPARTRTHTSALWPRPADAQTMGTLHGALKMGQIDMSEFVDADGPSALLDVVAEVTCKPKMSWLDLEVLVGALENLWELISNEVDATHI